MALKLRFSPVVNRQFVMAIKLTPPSPGRIILGPRGGRRRSLGFKHWLANAAGTPTFSTQAGASGVNYPIMRILLTDGNSWNYIFPGTGMDIVQSWDTVPLSGTSTFTPQSADGATWDAVASGPANSFSEGDGFFAWASGPTTMHFAGTIAGPIASRENAQVLLFNVDTSSLWDSIDLSTTPVGPWSWDVTMPDGSVTPVNMQTTPFTQTADGVTIEMTGTGSFSTSDFWNEYKIFPVPGYPGQWFGEWFNAVAWGTQLARVLDADLSTWLSTH